MFSYAATKNNQASLRPSLTNTGRLRLVPKTVCCHPRHTSHGLASPRSRGANKLITSIMRKEELRGDEHGGEDRLFPLPSSPPYPFFLPPFHCFTPPRPSVPISESALLICLFYAWPGRSIYHTRRHGRHTETDSLPEGTRSSIPCNLRQ